MKILIINLQIVYVINLVLEIKTYEIHTINNGLIFLALLYDVQCVLMIIIRSYVIMCAWST